MKKCYTTLIILLFTLKASAQISVSGAIFSEDGSPLPGVSVLIKGTTLGVITDLDGKYSLSVSPEATLIFSFIGFKRQEVKVGNRRVIDVTLAEDATELTELVIIGSRGEGRTKIETPAPVDVINISELSTNMPQMDLAQMLVATAPSFSAVRAQGGDLSSHVDPPTLRGLAPNQMLLLINGKRRHTSALLNSSQTGSSANAVDMSFIPAASIERVEILRDGAAAQYGSDAIAGVMNVILKGGGNKLTGSFTAGGFPNVTPDFSDSDLTPGEKALTRGESGPDGFGYQLSANYGIDFNNGGYLSVTGLYRQDKRTIRATVLELDRAPLYDATYLNNERTDINGHPIITNPELISALASGDMDLAGEMRTNAGLMNARGIEQLDVATYAGQPAINLGSMAYNLSMPIGGDFEFYSFGDLGYKYLEGYSCFYRRAAQLDRSNFDLYPNGFRPQMTSNQSNVASTMGVTGKIGDYRFDISNTFGRNAMRIGMFNTYNASLGSTSPVEMNLGKHAFTQNSANLDISRFFPEVLNGLNVGIGGEMRLENYKIEAGQPESYEAGAAGIYTAPYDDYALVGPDGQPLENLGASPIVDANGDPIVLPYGGVSRTIIKNYSLNCQCFRGFAPENEADQYRGVTAAYLDIELDVTPKFLVTGAVRTENYVDFGSVLTGKVASRYSLTDNFAIRGSFSKGFRAPSLQELNYSHTYTFFIDLVPYDGTIYPNNSTPARVMGIGTLDEERSTNLSFGFTSKLFSNFELTIDAYKIDIEDRIFSTADFSAAEAPVLGPVIGAGLASFRINGGDISTRGVEVVLNHKAQAGVGTLITTISGNFRKNVFEKSNIPDLNTILTDEELEGYYVERSAIGQFETGTPGMKAIGSFNYSVGKFSTLLRVNYWGEVIDRDSDMRTIYDTSTGLPMLDGEGNTVVDFADQTFPSETTFDVGITYQVSTNLSLTTGGNNIFNNYPDIRRYERRTSNLYSNYQQGSAGAYYFGRLNFMF